MRLGWTAVGDAIYMLYSLLCHQMAQRSFFLFGTQAMYKLDKLPLHLTGNAATDILLLREFRGNPELGWKVAWSDRMIAMYGGLWLGSVAYGLLRRHYRLKPLAIKVLLLLTLPIAIDGLAHMVSDISGLNSGFRYTNEWLVNLTGHNFADSFYQGDAIGSFNSWARLISGVLFGIGIAAFGLPLIDRESYYIARVLSEKLAHYSHRIQSLQGKPNGA
jgi:uncharacterized membrane protein